MEEKGFAFDEKDVVSFDFGSSFTVFDSENELNKEEASKESKKEETAFSFNFGDTNMTNGEEDASLKEGDGSSFSLFSNEQSEKVFEAVDGVKSFFEKTNEAEKQETDDEEPEIVEGEEEHDWGEPEHAWEKVLQETRKFQQGLANVIAEAHEKTVGGGFDFLNDNNEEEEKMEDNSFSFNFDVVSYAAETDGEEKPSTSSSSSKKKEKGESKNPYLGLIEKSNSFATIVRFEDKVEDFSNKMSNFNFLEKEEGEPDELPSAGPEMLEMFPETKNVEDDMREYSVRLMEEAGTISNYSNRVREKVDGLDLLCLRRLCSDNVVRYEVDGRWYCVRNNEFVHDYYMPEEGADRSIYRVYREKFTLHELAGLAHFCLRYRSIMGKCLWKQIEPSYLEYPDDNIDCSEYLSLFWVSYVHCLEVAPVLNKALDTSLKLQAFPFVTPSLSFPILLHQHVVFPATFMFGHFGNDDETTEVDRFWTLEMLLCQEQIVGAVRNIPCFFGMDLEDEPFKKDQMQIVGHLSNSDFSPSFTRLFRTTLWLRYKGWSKFRFRSNEVLEYLDMMQTEGSTIKALKILREKEGDLKLIPKSVFDYVLIPFIRSPPFEPAGVIPGLTPIEMSIFASNTRRSKLV